MIYDFLLVFCSNSSTRLESLTMKVKVAIYQNKQATSQRKMKRVHKVTVTAHNVSCYYSVLNWAK